MNWRCEEVVTRFVDSTDAPLQEIAEKAKAELNLPDLPGGNP
jgi:hypothetical protein